MKTLIKNAYILTMDDQLTAYEKGCIEIKDGVITHVGKGTQEDEGSFNHVIDAEGMLVTPGLHNPHTHSASNVIKAVYDLSFHAIGMWYIHAWTVNRTPEEIYYSTLLGCLEMLKTGTVSCVDHSPVTGSVDTLPAKGPEALDIDPIAEAFYKAGMKASIAVSVTDQEYVDIFPVNRQGLSKELIASMENSFKKPRSIEELVKLCKTAIERWNGYEDKIKIMVGPTSPLRCSMDLLKEAIKLQKEYGVGIHTHLLESKVQTEISQRRHGKTQVEVIDELGMVSDKLFCAHTNWVTDKEIEILGSKGASVLHNIGSNLRGSAGISPIYKLMKAGCNIALSTDGSSSNGSQNMFTITRLALTAHRINQPDLNKWLTTRDIVRFITRGGAKASMLEKTSGSLEPGKKADLVMFDLNSPWLTPLNEPYHLLAWAETGSSVDTVMIDGNIVVEKGKVLTLDEELVKKNVREMVKSIPQRNREIFKVIDEVTPILQEEHLKRFEEKNNA